MVSVFDDLGWEGVGTTADNVKNKRIPLYYGDKTLKTWTKITKMNFMAT